MADEFFDEDALFALAEEVIKEQGINVNRDQDPREWAASRDAICDGVAEQVAWYMRNHLQDTDPRAPQQTTASASSTGQCQTGICTGIPILPTIFTIHPNLVESLDLSPQEVVRPDIFTSPDGMQLHACIDRATCSLRNTQGVHEHNVSEILKEATVSVARGGAFGIFWCSRHLKIHVCDHRCREGVKTDMGFEECVLSKRVISSAGVFSFGDGTSDWTNPNQNTGTTASREFAPVTSLEILGAGKSGGRRDTPLTQRNPKAQRRSGRARALNNNSGDTTVGATARHLALIETTAPPLDQRADDPLADLKACLVDEDYPHPDMFKTAAFSTDLSHGNPGAFYTMYHEAYQTVHLLMFSARRSALEADQCRRVQDEVERRNASYLSECRARGRPFVMTVCKQFADRAANTKYVMPRVIVPEGAFNRLNAYWAMRIVEFYVQMLVVSEAMGRPAEKKARDIVERLRLYPMRFIFPNILGLLHEGAALHKDVLVDADPMLFTFPSAPILQDLGIPQRVCTDILKDMRQWLQLALGPSCKIPAKQLRGTALPMAVVLARRKPGEPSIVHAFLSARGGHSTSPLPPPGPSAGPTAAEPGL